MASRQRPVVLYSSACILCTSIFYIIRTMFEHDRGACQCQKTAATFKKFIFFIPLYYILKQGTEIKNLSIIIMNYQLSKNNLTSHSTAAYTHLKKYISSESINKIISKKYRRDRG